MGTRALYHKWIHQQHELMFELINVFPEQPSSPSGTEHDHVEDDHDDEHAEFANYPREADAQVALKDEETASNSSDDLASLTTPTSPVAYKASNTAQPDIVLRRPVQEGHVNSTFVNEDYANTLSSFYLNRTGKRVKCDKDCKVCGDRALGFNFGAISCESCKAFFRRNAFRDIWGRCNGTCIVTMESRSYCKKCRLKKCFMIGMKRDLILNERQKVERRQKIATNKGRKVGGAYGGLSSISHDASCDAGGGVAEPETCCAFDLPNNPHLKDVPRSAYSKMTRNSKELFQEMMMAFEVSFCQSENAPLLSRSPNNAEFLNMADESVRRLVKMSKHVSGFKSLDQEDQVALLKGAVLEILVLRSIKNYSIRGEGWSVKRPNQDGHLQHVTVSYRHMLEANERSTTFMSQYDAFARSCMNAARRDELVINILVLLSLLSPDRENVKDSQSVSQLQEQFAEVLREYIRENYPRDRLMLAQCLQQLVLIRNLHQTHLEMLQNARLNSLEPLIMEIFDINLL